MSLASIERRINELTAEMAAAVEREDYEAAAKLRDEIAGLRGQAAPNADAPEVRQPPPGQMGLGTHIPVAAPPKGWVKPRKPDLMTKNTSRRKR